MFQSRLVLATSVAAVILSGCTANGIKPDGKHAYLSIHSPELTRLSSQASVEVVTETRDGKSLTYIQNIMSQKGYLNSIVSTSTLHTWFLKNEKNE